MKILAFSDWRVFDPEEVELFIKDFEPDIDLVVYAGDDLNNFSAPRSTFIFDSRSYFERRAALAKKCLCLAVAGNDDFPDQKKILKGTGVIDLFEHPKVVDKFAFLGIEGSSLGPGILQHSEKELEQHL